MILKAFFLATRPQFLVLSPVLTFLGTSIAWNDGAFRLGYALLASVGLILVHISVNMLNDYFDYRSGLDLQTERTPFSGGSGVLPAAMLAPRQVLAVALGAFLLAVPIGIYFVIVSGWSLLPLVLAGALCIILYTPLTTRLVWPELVAGAGMGTLPILGMYFVQTGHYTAPAVMAAIPSGLLVHNLLLLNEFPDVEADRGAGRRNLPTVLGRARAGVLYSSFTLATYAYIIASVLAEAMPTFSLLSLLTIPLAVKAIRGCLRATTPGELVPALASNVMVVILTQLLLGIGYILAAAF